MDERVKGLDTGFGTGMDSYGLGMGWEYAAGNRIGHGLRGWQMG